MPLKQQNSPAKTVSGRSCKKMLPMVYKKAPFSLFMGWGAFYTEGVISSQKYALGGLTYHEQGDFSEKYHVRGIAAPEKVHVCVLTAVRGFSEKSTHLWLDIGSGRESVQICENGHGSGHAVPADATRPFLLSANKIRAASVGGSP